MSNMLNTALDLMGFLDTEDDEEEDGSEIETTPRKKHQKLVSVAPKTTQPTIVHMTPRAFEDVKDITKSLQNKKIVTMSFALVDEALRKRIFDFACGSVYALDGEFMKLADNVYLLAGPGVTLQDRQRDTLKYPWSKES
ncbi:MAG TPA: cell division protein SepF [Desulfosporosinus sp.]|nr:cell division protein SepF [Desulfosporosinus sp.]